MPITLTSAQAAKLGIAVPGGPPLASPPPGSHEAIVRTYSDAMLAALIADIGSRNLRDYSDHETRFLGERAKAARAERRRRKGGRP